MNSGYTLNADVILTDNKNAVVQSSKYSFKETYDFTAVNYSFSVSRKINDLQGLKITFTTNEVGTGPNWAGPEIRNLYASITYEQDKCAIDALSSSECKGYSKALLSKACSINSQVSTECSGYRPIVTTQNTSLPDYLNNDMINSISNNLYSLTSPYKSNNAVTPVLPVSGDRKNKEQNNQPNRNVNKNDPQTEKIKEITSSGPSLDLYTNATLKDASFYRPKEIYKNVIIPDNVRAQRQLTQRSNQSYGSMVDEQYRK